MVVKIYYTGNMPATKVSKNETTAVYQPKYDEDRPRCKVSPNGFEPPDIKDQEQNIAVHGYISPFCEYLNNFAIENLNQLAEKWGYDKPTVYGWGKRGKWDHLRALSMEKRPVEQGGKLASLDVTARRELLNTREDEILERLWLKLKEEIERPDVEQVSPSGGKVTVRKGARDRKLEISSFAELSDRNRITLGMPTKMTGAFAGANIAAITQIVVEKPAGYSPRPLPDPTIIEAESTVENSQ